MSGTTRGWRKDRKAGPGAGSEGRLFLERVVREEVSNEVTWKQRPEGEERASRVTDSGDSMSGRRREWPVQGREDRDGVSGVGGAAMWRLSSGVPRGRRGQITRSREGAGCSAADSRLPLFQGFLGGLPWPRSCDSVSGSGSQKWKNRVCAGTREWWCLCPSSCLASVPTVLLCVVRLPCKPRGAQSVPVRQVKNRVVILNKTLRSKSK